MFFLAALDYASDLIQFWLRTSKHKTTPGQSCEVVKDIISTIKTVADYNGRNYEHLSGKFLFGHTTGITSTAANLGLYKVRYCLVVSAVF